VAGSGRARQRLSVDGARRAPRRTAPCGAERARRRRAVPLPACRVPVGLAGEKVPSAAAVLAHRKGPHRTVP